MTLELIISQPQPAITGNPECDNIEQVEITCYSQLLEIVDNQCNVPWIQSNIQFLNTIKGEKGDPTEVTIGENGNWYIDGVDSGKPSRGEKGDTPIITVGDNGNWYVDGVDTGQKAQGEDGETPVITIGINGNWYINGVDTGVKAQGEKGDDGTSAYQIYVAGGGTLSEADYNVSITNIPTHISDATKHIDNTADEFSGTIDETNDKFTLWDNSLLKWIMFSFTSMKTWLSSLYLKLDQTTPQTITKSPKITSLTAGQLVYVNADKQLIPVDSVIWDDTKKQLQVGDYAAFSNSYGLTVQKSIICGGSLLLSGGNGNFSASAFNMFLNGVLPLKNTSTGINSAMSFYTKNIEAIRINPNQNTGFKTTTPKAVVDINGGCRIGDDTDAASADKQGTFRYRLDGTNASVLEICMKVGATTYQWVEIKRYTW